MDCVFTHSDVYLQKILYIHIIACKRGRCKQRDENLLCFQSDLQEILGMLKCRGNKKELLDYMNKREAYFRNVDEETYQVMREFLHSEKMSIGSL